MDRQFPKGTLLNSRYRVHLQLGAGGFGTVYRCMDSESQLWRAVKVIKRQNYDDESSIGERRVLEELQGIRGIPVMFDSFEHGNLEAIVMELFVGDLCSLRLKPFPPKLITKIAFEMITIVKSIHQAGFIHRDLKSANTMIPFDQENRRLVIVDYGMAVRFAKKKSPNGNSMRRIAVPCKDFNYSRCPFAARRCVEGQPAQETEDLEQVGLMLLELRGAFPFGRTREGLAEQKAAFAADPEKYLSQPNKFLLPILRSLLEQTYGEKPNYAFIFKAIRSNGHRVSEADPITIHSTPTGHPYIGYM